MLVVPSLINRWEVLDLTAEKSLLRAMAAAGLRPYLVDWGTPDAEERRFDLSAYVAAARARARLHRQAGAARPAVMGYCMGGTLAVALAQHRPRRVAGLALLAAPWDFHADKTGHAFLLTMGPALAELADKAGELPVDVLQTLFWSLDPWLAMKKFGRFLGMDQAGEHARDFVLLEDWLNDGAPLARPGGARMPGWLVSRQPAGHNNWVVGGKRIVPSRITKPALVMIPSGDRIVPPLSAAALVDPKRGLKGATRLDSAARPYRHGGERPRPRALLDSADRLVEGALMADHKRSVDWRMIAIWIVVLAISWIARSYVMVADESRRGVAFGLGRALFTEGASHLVVAALLPRSIGCIAAGRSTDRRSIFWRMR